MKTKESSDEKQYGIAAALSEALEAAVFADSTACYKAYDMIEKYAYEQDIAVEKDEASWDEESKSIVLKKTETTVGTTDLAMAKFTLYGSDGKAHEVSIPKITMMPLPLLHVTEAHFDFDLVTNIEGSASSEMNRKEEVETVTESSSLVSYSRHGRAIRAFRPSSAERAREMRNKAASSMRSSTSDVTNQQMVLSNHDTSSESSASTIKMNVKIEMKQAELPEGIRLLLQSAANSLQIAAKEISEVKQS